MLNANNKPSKRFCKYGFLTSNEPYNQDLHNIGTTIEERARDFYTPREIEEMENEVKNATNAECPICNESINNIQDCLICSEGHKSHHSCLIKYWDYTPTRFYYCPITNTKSLLWDKCYNTIEINSSKDNKKIKHIDK